MSFILDQLKKSGKQRALEIAMRRQTEKPEANTSEPLLVPSSDGAPVNPKKWRLPVISFLIGIAALYGAASFIRGTVSMSPPVVPAVKSPVQAETPLPAVQPSVALVKVLDAPAELERVSGPKSPETIKNRTEAAGAVKPLKAPEKGLEASKQADAARSTDERQKKLPALKIDAPVGTDSSRSVEADSFPNGSASTGTVLEIKQLPLSVRKSLPEIRITSHLYRRDSRLVSINGRIMSEGFNMDNGLYLEEITPEGVIVSFRNYRFSVRAD